MVRQTDRKRHRVSDRLKCNEKERIQARDRQIKRQTDSWTDKVRKSLSPPKIERLTRRTYK
jgi:hypothetical protein